MRDSIPCMICGNPTGDHFVNESRCSTCRDKNPLWIEPIPMPDWTGTFDEPSWPPFQFSNFAFYGFNGTVSALSKQNYKLLKPTSIFYISGKGTFFDD